MDETARSQLEKIVQNIIGLFFGKSGDGIMLSALRKGTGEIVGTVLAIRCQDPTEYAELLEDIKAMIGGRGGVVVNEEKVPINRELDWEDKWIN